MHIKQIVVIILPICFLSPVYLDCMNNDTVLSNVVREVDIEVILNTHNKLRNSVANGSMEALNGTLPSAQDMTLMVWDARLARSAQAHADNCLFEHYMPKPEILGADYGQNLYESWTWDTSAEPEWEKVVFSWFDEVKLFPVEHRSPYIFDYTTGHFSQVCWAGTNRVGCGYTKFIDSRPEFESYNISGFYTCNYEPSGNYVDDDMYTAGEPCTNCTCDKVFTYLCQTKERGLSTEMNTITNEGMELTEGISALTSYTSGMNENKEGGITEITANAEIEVTEEIGITTGGTWSNTINIERDWNTIREKDSTEEIIGFTTEVNDKSTTVEEAHTITIGVFGNNVTDERTAMEETDTKSTTDIGNNGNEKAETTENFVEEDGKVSYKIDSSENELRSDR